MFPTNRYQDGVADGLDVPRRTKIDMRANQVLSERIDRAAAQMFGTGAMNGLRRLWHEGKVDLAWDSERQDAALMPVSRDAPRQIAEVLAASLLR